MNQRNRKRSGMGKRILALLFAAVMTVGWGGDSQTVSAAAEDVVRAVDADTQIVYKEINKDILRANASDNSHQNDYGAVKAFDGNDGTYWHQKWNNGTGSAAGASEDNPIWIQTGFGKTRKIGKLVYKGKWNSLQNRITQYRIEVIKMEDASAEPAGDAEWTTVAEGTFANDITDKAVTFTPVEATHVRLVALGYNNNNGVWVSAREIEIYEVCQNALVINLPQPKAGSTEKKITVRDILSPASVDFGNHTLDTSVTSNERVDLSEGYDAFSGKYNFPNNGAGNDVFDIYGKKPFVIQLLMKIPAGTNLNGEAYNVIGKTNQQYTLQIIKTGEGMRLQMFAWDADTKWPTYRSEPYSGDLSEWTRATALYDGYGFWMGFGDGDLTRVVQSAGKNNITLAQRSGSTFTIGYNISSGSQPYPGMLADVKMYSSKSVLTNGALQKDGKAAAEFAKSLMTPDQLILESDISQDLPYTVETGWYKNGSDEPMPAGEVFESGNQYTAKVVLRSKNPAEFIFEDGVNELHKLTLDREELNKANETITVSADKSELRLEKSFTLWNVKAKAEKEETTAKGTVSVNGGEAVAEYSETMNAGNITLTAAPASGYRFLNWTDENGNLVSRDRTFSMELNRNIDYTAHFKPVVERTVNIAQGKNGSLDAQSFVEDDYPLTKMVDGKPAVGDGFFAFRSNTIPIGPTDQRATSYVTLDLGKQYCDIDRMMLYRYWKANEVREYYATVIEVSKTEDFNNAVVVYNSDTENVIGRGKGTEALYAESSAGHEIVLPEGVDGRYVRIYMRGSNQNASNHIVEFEVYAANASVEAKYVAGCEQFGEVSVDKEMVSYGDAAEFHAVSDPGYAFVGWYYDEEGTREVVNANAHHTILSVAENTVLYAKFDLKTTHLFRIVVWSETPDGNGAIIENREHTWQGLYNDPINLGDAQITVPDGKVFSHWAPKGAPAKVFALEKEYRFRIFGDLDLVPVFKEKGSAATSETPRTEVTNTFLIRDEANPHGNAKVRFVGRVHIPEGWTLNETGLLWTGKNSSDVETLRVDKEGNPIGSVKKTIVPKINVSHQFSATISGVPEGKTVRGVVYAKMTNDATNETQWFYSDQGEGNKEASVEHKPMD